MCQSTCLIWRRHGTAQQRGEPFYHLPSFDKLLTLIINKVSLHFRGPLRLKSLAFYAPSITTSIRSRQSTVHKKRHGHARYHQDRGIGDWVTVTMNGQVVSWRNEYGGPSISVPPVATSTTSMTQSLTTSIEALLTITSSPSSSYGALPSIIAEAGTWVRQAYYNATSRTADGLVFLNNHGGAGSGVFDFEWGMSLSYASSNSQVGAASPQILADTLLDDMTEVIVYTDKECEGDSCGFYRPGSVAYHGFDGNNKMFLMEFSMPHSGLTGQNSDMPAIWFLNAAIPRTQQYGSCSCWPQCGEWDIFEILNSGGDKAKSTLHADLSGGPDQYFERPVNKTMKAAILFDGSSSSGYIFVLPDDTTFGTSLTDDEVSSFGSSQGIAKEVSAKFMLGS